MKWLAMLFGKGPHVAFDWLDEKGLIDHGKAMGDTIIALLTLCDIYVAIRKSEFIPLWHILAFVAGAFGSRVLIAIFTHQDPPVT